MIGYKAGEDAHKTQQSLVQFYEAVIIGPRIDGSQPVLMASTSFMLFSIANFWLSEFKAFIYTCIQASAVEATE